MLRKIDYSTLVALVVVVLALSTTASAGLVGWWTFDETSGTTARDSSGNANNGTVVGNAKWVPGKIGGAFEFDGGTYINCGRKASLNVRNAITMSFWFKVKAFQNTWEAFLAKGDGSYRASRSNGTDNSVHMGITSSNYFDATEPIVTDDQWHHYAGIYDGTTATIYVDGVQAAQRTYSGPVGDSSSYDLYIGENQQATGRLLHGLLDDVRIYDRALTVEQLLDLVNNGISPSWNKAEKPNPADGATGVATPVLTWTKGDSAAFHDIYVGTVPDLAGVPRAARLPAAVTTHFHVPAMTTPGVSYYWRVDEMAKDGTIYTGDIWKFTMAPVTAYFPTPRNGDKWIATDVVLTWQPGQFAIAHRLYFSTDKAAVASRDAGALIGEQAAPTYAPTTPLTIDTTYYWAVDEVSATSTNAGELWKFTTVGRTPGGARGEYFNGTSPTGAPQLTRIDSSIDFSWGDPGGPGAPIGVDGFSARWTADLEIAIADTYTFITTSDDGVRLWLDEELIVENWTDHGSADNYSAPIALEPGVYALRMEYYENSGGAVAQLSWQTPNVARQIIPAGPLQPPVRAKPINPVDKDVNVPQDVTLMWSAGQNAVTHEIYFGEDEAAVEAATTADAAVYRGSQTRDENTWSPGVLEWNKTYYWRVDEVNDAAEGSPWKGAVWSFTTADFLVVDNFESYVDDDVGRIFQTWIDGWGYTTPEPGNPGNGTSSTVGYTDPPFAETSIVHAGRQSMPFDYNNLNQPYYSETDRTWAAAQNWKANDLSTLVLWFQGYPAKYVDDGTTITMSAAGSDIWNNADEFRFAYKRLSGDGSISVKVDSIVNTNAWAKAGVMIRESLAPGSANAANVVSAASGVSFQYRSFTDDVSNNTGTSGLVAPYWVRLTRTGNTFKGEMSADGKTWTTVGTDATLNPRDVVIGSNIYIGLCVTSHNTNPKIATTGVFSDIKTTGGVSGQWQVADIGLTHPGNDVELLYVAVQDNAGKVAVVTNPDAQAVLSTTWTEWRIPTSSFTGVNLGSVKKMFIGVGDRTAPKAGGHGKLFIDDIRVIK